MLELKNLKKFYKTKSGTVSALDGVSLTFPATGLVFVTGKSGCGKTTLLNVIGGLDSFDQGEISLLDKSFSAFSPSDYNDYRNTFIGFIFQEYNLLSEFTVEKNIELAMELQGGKSSKEELDKLLEEVGISELKNRKPAELSGGQRQRVAIARALVKKPRIIMADEPTGALDSATGEQVLQTLKSLSKDKLVIVVSHDREFAEKYADRIIRLVDGKVEEDVVFSENELNENVYNGKDALLVRQGTTLTDSEKEQLATAVKDCKKIELIEKLTFREKKQTRQEQIQKATGSVELQKSKMKVSSSLLLGLKSLWVKPFRLILTIILSVVAFAVFGLFDTVANFNTADVVNNLLRNSSKSVALYGEYIIDDSVDDKYAVKLSETAVERIAEKTGYNLKGVYDFTDNTTGKAVNNLMVTEILDSSIRVGKYYYTNNFNGFIEFSVDDINSEKEISPFGYKVVAGEYPQLVFVDGVPTLKSMSEIAISSYMAQSIIHYSNGMLGEETVAIEADLINKSITIDGEQYTIKGIIDCGKIDQKYDELKDSASLKSTQRTLYEDFSKEISSGAQKCVFTAKGFLDYKKAGKSELTTYYGGDADWYVNLSNGERKSANQYLYSSSDVDGDTALLFDRSGADKNFVLADDEILIHPANIRTLYSSEYLALEMADKIEATRLINIIVSKDEGLSAKRTSLNQLLDMFGASDFKTVELRKTSDKTDTTITKVLKVRGVYINADVRVSSNITFRLMMNKNLMKEFKVYEEQGEYSRVLVTPRSSRTGAKVVANYMLSEQDFSLVWYGNSALNTIKDNEEVIRQGADLFLYVAIILAVFSVFMLFNYIATSIVNKRQSIGVLRGLGAGGKDILLMFVFESLIIALINIVLATCMVAVGCVIVNMYILNVMNINIPFALFGIRQALIIFGLSIFTAVISSAMPILKISKEKPVDLIRKP